MNMGSLLTRVVLTGFMGAGKSTVGALLAARLGWRFVDVDQELVAEHGIPIAGLFSRHGEAGFRLLEAAAFQRCVHLEQAVIALGGGALESPSTRNLLLGSPGTQVVFLETPLPVALARCAADGAIRPVLAEAALVETRFERRLEHYRQAHHTIDTAERTPGEVVEELRTRLALVPAARSQDVLS
jgi:shikimate kinase